LFRYLVY